MRSEALKRAKSKHVREKCDDIRIRPPKGTKDVWKNAAAEKGLSMQRYIITTVNADCNPETSENDR